MAYEQQEQENGRQYKPEVKNVIRLTLEFAKAVGAQQKDKADNLVVSPYNAMAALAMVGEGADNDTRREIAETLFGTDGAGLDDAAKAYAALNSEILAANKDQVELKTASSIWTNKDLVTLRQSYADDMKQTFDASVSAEDYADPATVKKINDWASENTNGMIKDVLKQLNADDAAVLASALFFKGKWTKKFDKNLTEDKAFTSDGAVVSETPTMHQDFGGESGLTYQSGKDYEAVALTYGEKKHTDSEYKVPTMRIVLVKPTDANVSARDWLAAQDAAKVPAWLDNYAFQKAVGPVELPHMKVKQKHDLKPALQAMGINAAFTGAADFTKMVEKDGDKLYVSKVTQDTALESDEEGSALASVTTAVVTREVCFAEPPVKVDVKFDRSFVFALQDIKTGAVLFVGAVNKPNENMKPLPKASAAPKV